MFGGTPRISYISRGFIVGVDKIIQAWSVDAQYTTSLMERDERLAKYRDLKTCQCASKKSSEMTATMDDQREIDEDGDAEDDTEAGSGPPTSGSTSTLRTPGSLSAAVDVPTTKPTKKSKKKQKKKNAKSPYSITVVESASLQRRWSIEHNYSINALAVASAAGGSPSSMADFLSLPVFVADTSSDISMYRI